MGGKGKEEASWVVLLWLRFFWLFFLRCLLAVQSQSDQHCQSAVGILEVARTEMSAMPAALDRWRVNRGFACWR